MQRCMEKQSVDVPQSQEDIVPWMLCSSQALEHVKERMKEQIMDVSFLAFLSHW